MLKSHIIVQTSKKLIDFLSMVFWAQNVVIPTFLILLMCTKIIFTSIWSILTTSYSYPPLPTFIIFHQFSLSFTKFYKLLYYFYLLFPSFTKFYYLLSIFTKFYAIFTLFLQNFSYCRYLPKFYHFSPTFYQRPTNVDATNASYKNNCW